MRPSIAIKEGGQRIRPSGGSQRKRSIGVRFCDGRIGRPGRTSRRALSYGVLGGGLTAGSDGSLPAVAGCYLTRKASCSTVTECRAFPVVMVSV